MNKNLQIYKSNFEKILQNFLDENTNLIIDNKIRSAIYYSCLNAGKRIRALFIYSIADILKVPILKVDNLAISIELIHCFSLIHDDLPAMDDDCLRRGKNTCHIEFNEAIAILTGDALQNLAIESLTNIKHKNNIFLIKTLSQETLKMILGQSLDIQAENKNISLQELENIHINKTGALLKWSILSPLYLSNFEENLIIKNTLKDFARNIGLAFQIQDDILDITQISQVLGKNAKSDEKLNKSTYPKLLNLNKSKDYLENIYKKAQDNILTLEDNLKNTDKVYFDNLKYLLKFLIKRTF